METTNDPNNAHDWILALARRGYNAEARIVAPRAVGPPRAVGAPRRVSEYPVCMDESCIHERTTSFDHLTCEDAKREARKGEPQGVFVPSEANSDYCDGCKQHALQHDDDEGACPTSADVQRRLLRFAKQNGAATEGALRRQEKHAAEAFRSVVR